MEKHPQVSSQTISVIVPCYNHAHYLPEALESIFQQRFPSVEAVVVDDGSTDNTREVAARYPDVKYVYQRNSGLSAARNTGIRHSTGTYLLFLDADDWLYPEAMHINHTYLQQHPEAAFVSGAYTNVSQGNQLLSEQKSNVQSAHHLHFLSENYIGMVATVLFQRWALAEFQFDENLRACEDYDLYLRISRKYPVGHHTEKIAAYRRHGANMSSDAPLMISSMLHIVRQHRPKLRTAQEKAVYHKTCHALYKQIFNVKGKVPEGYWRVFREDRFAYLYHQSIHYLRRLKAMLRRVYNKSLATSEMQN